jgi:hypothetical protein
VVASTHTAFAIARRARGREPLEVRVLAAQAGVSPALVAHLMAAGLLEAASEPEAAARLARAARLRRDLGLNYAGAALACRLLDRIDELEARLRRYEGGRNHPR